MAGKQFTAILELVEAEDQRRFAAHLLRSGLIDRLTVQEARVEHAKLMAEQRVLKRQSEANLRRDREIWGRYHEIERVILRAHVETLIGEFVTIRNPGTAAEKLQPKAGDIGRLLKVQPTGALLDFGDELRTWYIPLWAVGDVKDPFADDRRKEDAN